MRFGISHVLDAIEARVTTDPALARGVLELAEIVRLVDLDGDTGKPATLLRLGRVVDALGGQWGEDGVAVYVVAARGLLSDLDLTSNERMVIRRWADDGLVEVLDEPGDRVLEVAELLGVPVLSRRSFREYAGRYRWLPNGVLQPTPTGLTVPPGGGGVPTGQGAAWLARLWRCPEPGCASFGRPAGSQPPPLVRSGAPTCPRHGTRLADSGRRPPARILSVRIDGTVRHRLVVREGAPVVIGRSPGPGEGLALGPHLGEEAMRWVSRIHLQLELRGDALVAIDLSTNGTTVQTGKGPVPLPPGQAQGVGADDVIELYRGVEVGRPARFAGGGGGAPTGSVMAEAPTVALRLPAPQ